MRKVTDQFTLNAKILDKKLAKIYADINLEKVYHILEKKLGKAEAYSKFEGINGKMQGIEKFESKRREDYERLEVCHTLKVLTILCICVQSYVENIGFAVRNLEKNKAFQDGVAAAGNAVNVPLMNVTSYINIH